MPADLLVPYRELEFPCYGLVIRWAITPCLLDPETCPVPEHTCGLVALEGSNRWCAVAHGVPGRDDEGETELEMQEAWGTYARAAAAFGAPWDALTPAILMMQLEHALGMSDRLWDELLEWDVERIPLMMRRGRGDFYVIPQLLACTAQYRRDVGGTKGPTPWRSSDA